MIQFRWREASTNVVGDHRIVAFGHDPVLGPVEIAVTDGNPADEGEVRRAVEVVHNGALKHGPVRLGTAVEPGFLQKQKHGLEINPEVEPLRLIEVTLQEEKNAERRSEELEVLADPDTTRCRILAVDPECA
jgi:hypothetical protein